MINPQIAIVNGLRATTRTDARSDAKQPGIPIEASR
jgi:hypothetical protein